jgi:RHS repeat-associated protein
MLSDGTNSFVWDARNRLGSMNNASASFQYDAFGRRVSKSFLGTSTTFLYDGANIVQELSGSTPLANLLSGGIDEVFTRTDASGSAGYLSDALGSTVALADGTGAARTQYTYEPFGNTSISGTATTSSYDYTGRELDPTGLYYYRARYYDPSTGRFISEDPIGFLGGSASLYSYVANSPQNFVDPRGLIIGVIGDTESVNKAINYLKRDPGMSSVIAALEKSDTVYTIVTTTSLTADYSDPNSLDPNLIMWNPNLALNCVSYQGHRYGAVLSPAMALGHELAHFRYRRGPQVQAVICPAMRLRLYRIRSGYAERFTRTAGTWARMLKVLLTFPTLTGWARSAFGPACLVLFTRPAPAIPMAMR